MHEFEAGEPNLPYQRLISALGVVYPYLGEPGAKLTVMKNVLSSLGESKNVEKFQGTLSRAADKWDEDAGAYVGSGWRPNNFRKIMLALEIIGRQEQSQPES